MSENLSIVIKTLLSQDIGDINRQIQELSKKITEKLSVKLQIDASQLSVITSKIEEANKKINNASKTAISKADQGAMYEQVKSKIAQLGTEMKKNGAQLLEWTAQTKAKTGEITGATIKYADSLGRVKTELYSVVKTYEKLRDENNKFITDKKGNPKEILSSIDLKNTTNKYSQNIGASQKEYFAQAKTELGIIQGLKKEQLKVDNTESELYKLLNHQIATHEKTLNEILATKIKISKTDDTSAVSTRQQTALNKIIKNNNDELDRLKTKQGQSSSKSTTSSVSTGNLKDIDLNIQRINNSLETLKVNKDKVFADSRVVGEVSKLKEMETAYKNGSISLKEYQTQMGTLRTRVSQVSGEFQNVNKDGYAFSEMIGLAAKKILIWGISTNIVYGSFKTLKSGISYISELDNALNEIRIVTNKTQVEVQNLANSYNSLAKEMSVTTKELAGTAADLYRQGLNDNQVEERMKGIVEYAKISSISLNDSNKIITATANATGESVQKIIDIFSQLGDLTAAGPEEIGEALQRVASAAENSNITLEKSASWLATISSITRESASTIGRSLDFGAIAV